MLSSSCAAKSSSRLFAVRTKGAKRHEPEKEREKNDSGEAGGERNRLPTGNARDAESPRPRKDASEQSQTEKGRPTRAQARRARARIGPGKDGGSRREGTEVAGRLQRADRLRRRPDAARSPAAQARFHQHLQERVRGGECVAARSLRCRSDS